MCCRWLKMRNNIALALALNALLCGCSGYGKAAPKAPTVQKIKGFTLYEVMQSTRTWTLSAELAEMAEGDTTATLTNPVLEYTKKQGSTVRAQQGLFDFDKKTVFLSGKVVAVAKKEKITLKTETLNYSPDKALIWTNDKVQLTEGGTVVNGKGFQAKPDLSELVIKHQQTSLGK